MIIDNPSRHLLIIAKNKDCCDAYVREQELRSIYPRRTIHYAGRSSSCQGYGEVDIMFAPGWWESATKRDLLDLLELYLKIGIGKIVGDRAMVPTGLLLAYDVMVKGMVPEVFDPIETRFEILDL